MLRNMGAEMLECRDIGRLKCRNVRLQGRMDAVRDLELG